MYDCNCENCKADKINLAAKSGGTIFKSVLKAAENAFKHLHEKGSYSPEDLKDKPYKKLIEETNKVLSSAITDNDIPPEMLAKLQNDTFVFSGLRAHAQLLEASSFLMEDGKIRGFDAFANDFNKVNVNYNENYLEAEYQFAVSSSQSAANWAALDPNGRYNLQYRTANDDRVRADHAALQNITLPVDDNFWLTYYPPNGWRCRCLAVEVLKNKFELSDSVKANEAGDRATTKLGPDGKNRSAIFRFNPGAEQKVFPPKHPYNQLKGADEVKKEVKQLQNVKDLSDEFTSFAKDNKDFFQRGFKEIKITRAKNLNGFTDMNGVIALKPEIAQNTIDGINNIRNGKKTTFNQEQSISTLHHELWHNASKPGIMRMTKDQTQNMELANEFVSRKTLPEFMEKLGGKLENKELTETRSNTSYNKMVVNYDKLIKWSESAPEKVLKSVKVSLVEDKYTEQMKGLVSAIETNSKFKIKTSTIQSLINYAKKYDAEAYAKLLESNEKLRLDRE